MATLYKIPLIIGCIILLFLIVLIIGIIKNKRILKLNKNEKEAIKVELSKWEIDKKRGTLFELTEIQLKEDNEKIKKYSKDKHYFVDHQGQNYGMFSVYVNKNYVDVFIIPKNMNQNHDFDRENINYYTEKVANFIPKNVFVDDTILIELANNEYVYIGMDIYKFTAKAKILNFSSSGGKAGVDYAFATDENKNIYLLLDYIILEKYNINYDEYEDPYDYYYTFYHHLDMDMKKNNKTKLELKRIEKLKEEKKNIKISHLKTKIIVD